MDFEKDDCIINIRSLKARLFDELASFAIKDDAEPEMLMDRFLTYMEIIDCVREVGTEVGE